MTLELVDVLRRATEAVQTAVPEQLQAAALPAAIALAADGSVSRVTEANTDAGAAGASSSTLGGESALAKVAAALKIDIEAVNAVFDVDAEGSIELVVSSARLPEGMRQATQEIAILMTAARQLGGIEDYTPLDVIRRVCEDHKRLDGSNFAKAVSDVTVFSLRGKPRAREARLSRAGHDQARALIVRLSGVDL